MATTKFEGASPEVLAMWDRVLEWKNDVLAGADPRWLEWNGATVPTSHLFDALERALEKD